VTFDSLSVPGDAIIGGGREGVVMMYGLKEVDSAQSHQSHHMCVAAISYQCERQRQQLLVGPWQLPFPFEEDCN
jgi:hypothetical protein